jgi:murein L,D-transpeptidase YcbB/YkuD
VSQEQDGVRTRIDPATIDWSRADAGAGLRVRQPPGPRNPLGRVKFLFPNPYGVYLHGTPGRAAFERPVRALSHGCIRVADEIALGVFALAPDPGWSRARLEQALVTERERRVALPEPVPLHVLYFTAEADAEGTLRFAPDPYGWDARLAAALGEDEPGSRRGG